MNLSVQTPLCILHFGVKNSQNCRVIKANMQNWQYYHLMWKKQTFANPVIKSACTLSAGIVMFTHVFAHLEKTFSIPGPVCEETYSTFQHK